MEYQFCVVGAFYGGNQSYEKPSRQADALIDDVTNNIRDKPLRRAKSTELPTIEEVDGATTTERSKSVTSFEMSCKGSHKKHRNKINKSALGRFG